MLGFLVVLTSLSILALASAFIWVLVSKGEKTQWAGKDVGAELMRERLDENDEWSIADQDEFREQAKVVGREDQISFSEVKKQVSSGNWKESFPLLLAVGGFLGLLLFGSLALFFALGGKLIGGLIAAVAIFTVVRILVQMARA